MLVEGLEIFYHSKIPPTTNKKYKKLLEDQIRIGWEHFATVRLTKSLTVEMKNVYRKLPKHTRNFTGHGWSKNTIEFLLTTHIQARKDYCNMIVNKKYTYISDVLISSQNILYL